MTLRENSSSGGAEATRIEMTSPEIKTGRSIWKFYIVLFLGLVVALAVIVGIMLHESAEQTQASPMVNLSEAVALDGQPESDVPNPTLGPAPETASSVSAAEPEPTIALFNKSQVAPEIKVAEANPASAAVKIGDIYQDEDGVWRNQPPLATDPASAEFYQDESGVWHNRQLPPSRSASSQSNSNLGASLPAGLMDMLSSGASDEGADLSGLFTSGVLNAPGGGDLLSSGSLEALSGLLNSAGGLDSLGTGDLLSSGSLEGLTGLLNSSGSLDSPGLGGILGAASGMDTGDISGLADMLDAVLGGQSGLTGGVFSGRDTDLPQANVISSSPVLWGQPSSASPSTPASAGDSGLRLDGYEQFDPATAGKIESEWEFFVAD